MSDKEDNKITRCPSCGAGLDSFESRCPYCGNEIRNVKLSKAIEKFTEGLNRITSKALPEYKPKDSLLRSVIGENIHEDEKREEFEQMVQDEREQEIATYISNYAIPNSKEDIIEFMILATTNVDLKFNSDVVKSAWANKMNQIYEKAKLTLKGNDLERVKEIYEKGKSSLRTKQLNSALYIGSGILAYFALFSMIDNPFKGLFIFCLGFALLLFLYGLINKGIKIGFIEINNKIVKYICFTLVGLGLILGLRGCFYEESDGSHRSRGERDYYNDSVKKNNVTIDIDFEGNLIFNKYNVVIKVYDKEDTLHHGKDKKLEYKLPDGEHEIEFTGDGMVERVTLKVKGDTYVKYLVKCKEDEIFVQEKDYSSEGDSVVEEKDN